MPSPFPGMDPFIEITEWAEFHVQMIVEIQRLLSPLIRPKYIARTERRDYLEHLADERRSLQPDVQIFRSESAAALPVSIPATATVEIEPHYYVIPLPQEQREAFVEIRTAEDNQVVTVIELLSPSNKRRGGDGFRSDYEKREELLRSGVNLIEIDLLRLGTKLLTATPLNPNTDYCAFLHRANRRPQAEVYEWTLQHRLPTIPIPLAGNDADVHLPLQQAFTTVYDFNAYELTLRYRDWSLPDLRESDTQWLSEIVKK